MEQFQTAVPWLQKLLPDGIPIPSATIITGPAGAGKPLVGAVLLDSWLKQGGTLVHLLINFNRDYSERLFLNFDRDFNKYSDKITYVEFDPEMDGLEKSAKNMLQANLLKADIFDAAIRQAKALLPESKLGPLVYGSALNMLLFSPTYGAGIHKKISAILQSRENYLFTIANNTFEEQVAEWESMADNLFFTHGTGIMRLGFKVLKLRDGRFNKEEVRVPLTEDELYTMHSEADTARKHLIPIIRKI